MDRPVCRDWSPIPCPERKAARDRGEIGYLWGLGWVWWKSKDVLTPWVRCPWCDGYLPSMEKIVRNGILYGWPDGEA